MSRTRVCRNDYDDDYDEDYDEDHDEDYDEDYGEGYDDCGNTTPTIYWRSFQR